MAGGVRAGRTATGGTQVRASLEASIGFQMGRAHRTLRSAWERRIADLGVSAPQAAMLRVVCDGPEAGLRELGRRVRTDTMNARRLVDHLVQLQLVDVAAGTGQGRRRVLHPTARGVAMADEIARRADALESEVSAMLGDGGLTQLRSLLGRLQLALDEAADRP